MYVGDRLGSRSVDTMGSLLAVMGVFVVRLDVGINIFGSRMFSISRDIIVTDILHQGSVNSVGGQEKI
jgi:hypothetical protein